MSEPYDPNQSYWAQGNPGYQGPPSGPSQAQPHPAQPHPAQPHPAQPHPAQPYPVQPYPAPGLATGPYFAPIYSMYPDPRSSAHGRPGQVVAAAVLGYIEAGFLVLTGLILFSGSSAVSDWSSSNNGNDHGWGAQFAFAGLADIVAAGLLIAGGVGFTGGNRLGRTLLAAGLAACAVEAIFWISWLDDSSGFIFPLATLYLIMPIIASSMSYSGPVTRWLDARASGAAILPRQPRESSPFT